MTSALRSSWKPIVFASLGVWVVSGVLVTAVIFGYAFSLGWAARGAPDQATINDFANAFGPLWGPRIGALLTGVAAVWVGRRAAASATASGLLLGLIVGVMPLMVRERIEPGFVATALLFVVLGAAGGWVGGQLSPARDRTDRNYQ